MGRKQTLSEDIEATYSALSAGANNDLEVAAQTQRKMQEAFLEIHYPNWRAILKSAEFLKWYALQSEHFRGLGDSQLAVDAIRVLDIYEREVLRVDCELARLRSANAATPKLIGDLAALVQIPLKAAKRRIDESVPVVAPFKAQLRAQRQGLLRARLERAKQITDEARERAQQLEGAINMYIKDVWRRKKTHPGLDEIYRDIIEGKPFEKGFGGKARTERVIRKLLRRAQNHS